VLQVQQELNCGWAVGGVWLFLAQDVASIPWRSQAHACSEWANVGYQTMCQQVPFLWGHSVWVYHNWGRKISTGVGHSWQLDHATSRWYDILCITGMWVEWL